MPHAACGRHCCSRLKGSFCAQQSRHTSPGKMRGLFIRLELCRNSSKPPQARRDCFTSCFTAPKAHRSCRARMTTICMANQRRVARVSKQLEREIGALLQGDQVLVNAICPEHRLGHDSSVSALATVTEVRLSTDLQVAKVYLSIYSDEEGKATALRGLARLQGYVRTRVAKQMQLRMAPEIRFIHDDAAERGEEVLRLLEQIKRQDAGEEELPPVAIASLPEEEKAQAAAREATDSQAGAKEDAEDGFLNLSSIDEEISKGFLDDLDDDEEEYESEYGAEEDDDEDNTNDVVEEYLAGIRAAEGALASVSSSTETRRGGRKKKRKYRSKTR